MSEYASRPNLPGYVSVKEAANILGISDKRVYEYLDKGRLSSMWVADVIVIPLDEVKKFKRRTSGRPRKSVPAWRISTGDNMQFVTSIVVQILPGQKNALLLRLEELRRNGQHTFPGTIARFIVESETIPGQVEITLVWRRVMMPKDGDQEQVLEDFRQALIDVLDWNTAQYRTGRILMHT